MKCALDFVKWMMEPEGEGPEGEGNGAPARALYGFVEDTNVPTSWTFMEREDVQDLLQQPWLVFLNVNELGLSREAATDPKVGYLRAGDVQAFLDWLVQRDIASHAEVDMLLAQYTLGLMED